MSDPKVPLLNKLHNGHVLGAAAFLVLPASIFSVPFAAPILITAALLALVVMRMHERRWPAPPGILVILLLALLGYGALSSLWAVQPRLSLVLAARLLGLFLAGLVLVDAARHLAPEERSVFERTFLAGFLCGLALLIFEELSAASLNQLLRNLAVVKAIIGEQRPLYEFAYFNRTATLVGLLIWPATAIVHRRGSAGQAVVLVLLALASVYLARSETAKFAFVAAGLVYLGARAWPHRAAAALGALIILGILTAPLVLHPKFLSWAPGVLAPGRESTLFQRLAIWDFVADKIAERPLFGWGLNSSRVIPGGHQLTPYGGELLPLHPHDMALQIWLELGVPGVLIALLLVITVTRICGRLKARPEAQAAALAGVAAAATNAIAGYDLWHPWWLSFLWLTAAFSVASPKPGPFKEARATRAK